MVVGASITVNNSRNSGSVDSGGTSEETKVLKQILQQLKEQNKQTMVAGRKSESGLGGGVGVGIGSRIFSGLGGATGLGLGGLFAALTGIGGSTSTGQRQGDIRYTEGGGYVTDDGSKSYAKLDTANGTRYAELDRKTGSLVRILTEQEARELDLLDDLDNIKVNKANEKTISKSILANAEMSRDAYVITEELMAEINDNLDSYDKVTKDTIKWARIARDAQKKIAEELARKANMKISAGDSSAGQYTTVFGATKGPMSMDPNAVPLFNLGDQTSSNIEKEVLYSIDTSNVARNIFWGANK